MKLHPVGGELFPADRKTDRPLATTRLMVAFYNFSNAPKNGSRLSIGYATQFFTL